MADWLNECNFPSSWLPFWCPSPCKWNQHNPPRKEYGSESKGSLGFLYDSRKRLQGFCYICSGVPLTSTLRQPAARIPPAQDQAACLFPACLLLGYSWTQIRDRCAGWYVYFHKRKALQAPLNLGNLTDHRVKKEKGIPRAFLILRKCIPSV